MNIREEIIISVLPEELAHHVDIKPDDSNVIYGLFTISSGNYMIRIYDF